MSQIREIAEVMERMAKLYYELADMEEGKIPEDEGRQAQLLGEMLLAQTKLQSLQ